MKYGQSVTRLITASLLLVMACQNPEEEGPGGGTTLRSNVNGTVLRSDNNTGVPGVIVRDIAQVSKVDTTDANGAFSLAYDLPTGQAYSTTIYASRQGFGSDSAAVTLVAGRDTTALLVVVADSTSPPTTPGSISGQPASIVLVGTDVNSISIRGTGVNESALLTFEVRDSLGNPVLGGNGPIVRFSLLGAPDGGEYLYPDSGQVNGTTGRVTTRLNSGTRPGVIQVVASTRNDSVLSSPARITIASGPPYGPNASISRASANLPGLLYDNERTTISVLLGDRYQNPVPAGTAVYFTTTGGIVQPTAYTDDDGFASVELITANPRPAGGIATITARTIGDTAARKADSLIQLQIPVVFSGAAQIVAPTAAFAVPDSGSYSFAYQVGDANGNPLIAGTTIKVTLSGTGAADLEAKGDVDVTMGDTDDPAETNFNATIVDKTRGGTGGTFTVTIEVKGRNGNATHTFAGLALTTGGGSSVPGATSIPRSIALNAISARTLSVKGTGANETSRLTFVVRDSLGNPIGNPLDPTQRAWVTFSINPAAAIDNGGAFVYPTGDSTDVNGLVSVTFNAGSKAAVFQVVATTLTSAGPITASPVQLTIQGGLPDSTRFFVTLDQVNMPGLVKAGTLGQISVQAGDEFGNPVQPGTAIYFSTNIGLVKASANTNESGVATVPLSGGVVGVSDGQGNVTVQTLDKNGNQVKRLLPFLFTGTPVISNVPASGFSIPDSGYVDFTFTVADANGNPLSKGATISVSKDGAGSADLTLTGDVNKSMPDTRSAAATTFSFRATDKTTGGPAGPVVFTVEVAGPNGEATASFSGTQLVTGQPGTGGSGSGYASSIEYLGSQSNITSLSVRGTGENESVVIRFGVKDSLGNPVDLDHRATVTLTIEGGPGGGEFLSPVPATFLTDASGQVYATLNSGTKAGVMQIRATTVVNGRTITSAPVPFTIHGGLPYLDGMTVWTTPSNMSWVPSGSVVGQIFVQLADRFGNPVQDGTAIYFSSNGGLVDPRGQTSNGLASVNVRGGLPFPPGGIDTVTITTVGDDNSTLVKYVVFTFSGAPVLTVSNAPTDTVTILDGGFFDLDFQIADADGNPLAAGNTVTLAVSSLGGAASGITLSGDVSTTTTDSRLVSSTYRRVRLADAVINGGNYGNFTITIRSSGPNGSAERTLVGVLGAPQSITPPSATVKNPAQIAFIGVSSPDVYVSGVGALENSVITYEVRDSLGNPIEANPRAYVTFSITFYPNTFVPGGTNPVLIPGSDSTDNSGRARVSMSSGTRAGVVQIVASTVVGVNTITSLPVKITIHAGFPDQRHFTMAPDRYNFPGLDKAFVTQKVTVQVADKYSNPVQAGTAVYFYSTHGTMSTGGGTPGLTDGSGFVSQTLYSANPYPEGPDSLSIGKGFTYVYSQTLGEAGVQVIDSLEILWTGQPVITVTSAPALPFAIANGGSAGPWTFTVTDRFGHPMSAGTSISVSVSAGVVTGDADVVLPDTKLGGSGVTDFTIQLEDDDSATSNVPLASTFVTVVVSHPTYGTYKKIIGSGTVQ